jgi:hypothetical protein
MIRLSIFSIIFIIILIIIVVVARYAPSAHFTDITTTPHNIINYISGIQAIQSSTNTPPSSGGMGERSHPQLNTAEPTQPISNAGNIAELGFSSCDAARAYYKANDLDPTPLAMCATLEQQELDARTDVNTAISRAAADVHNNLNSRILALNPEKLYDYMSNRVPPPFYEYAKTLAAAIPDISAQLYNREFAIIPQQFLLLNDWSVLLQSDTITFIYDKLKMFQFHYTVNKTHSNIIYIKLGALHIMNREYFDVGELERVIQLLRDIHFTTGYDIYITNVAPSLDKPTPAIATIPTFAFKTSALNTLFLFRASMNSTAASKPLSAQFTIDIN